jgi:hypothetical protein
VEALPVSPGPLDVSVTKDTVFEGNFERVGQGVVQLPTSLL